jgi:hypothetical protein
MLIELLLDSCYSHGPVGRSHMARRGARSDGPQAHDYNAQDQRRKIEKSERSRLSTMLRTMQVTTGK